MALTASERRELTAQSHRLKAVATLDPGQVGAAVVAHVRACFTRQRLIKVRVNADSGAECDAAGAALAGQVPCELVRRIGKVLLLYRAPAD